jgi:hypothetical protein
MAKAKHPGAMNQGRARQMRADPKAARAKGAAGKAGATKDESPDARIFPVDTRFQQMARRAGGVPRDRAIEGAEAALEEAKPGYDAWLERELQGLSELVKSAETGKAGPGWIETAVFRCRELRDSAAPLGYELLAFIANSLCELLESFEAGGEYNMESIICHIDALMLARQGSYRRMKPEQVPELTRGLQRVVKHVTI